MKKPGSIPSKQNRAPAHKVLWHFSIALQFLTIIPLPSRKKASIQDEDIANATIFFPLVGCVIGVVLAGLYMVFDVFFVPVVAAAFLLTAWIFLSGALHVDGFADTVDGLCGGENRAAILRIMKDSCTGAKGVVGVALLVLVKYCLLVQLISSPRPQIMQILIYVPVVARWGMLIQCYSLPYVKEQGMGTFSRYLAPHHLIFASLVVIVIGFFALGLFFLMVLGGVGLFSLVFSRYLKKRIGGFTGDTLGAVNELGEIVALVVGVFA